MKKYTENGITVLRAGQGLIDAVEKHLRSKNKFYYRRNKLTIAWSGSL